MTQNITSPQNKRIKQVAKLSRRTVRDEARQTVVEGVREINLALAQGNVPVETYLCPELIAGEEAETAARYLVDIAAGSMTELFYVTPEVFAKMAYRDRSGGLLIVLPYHERTLESLVLSDTPLVVIVEGAEKPGNLGAILRTADAAGVDALIVPIGPDSKGTDLHNPNVIRASLGAFFTVPLVAAPAADVVAWLDANAIPVLAATPEANLIFTAANMTGPLAIATGSEAEGLSDLWREAAAQEIRIPMAGTVDSLNLATATALLVYEAVRQRSGLA